MMLFYSLLLGLALPDAATTRPNAVAQDHQQNEQHIRYGEDPLQELLFWSGNEADAPLIVFIHGGGWSRGDMRTGLTDLTREHWQSRGYAIASLNYRLVPETRVEDQGRDIASAIAMLVDDADTLGFNAERIVLIGHSAGAHLAALVASDPQYLAAESLSPAMLRGVIALDGAGYDVPAQMRTARRRMGDVYHTAFGDDAVRQQRLSPIAHTDAPNAQSFLILHVDRRASRGQSIAFAEAINAAGTPARVESIPGRGMRGHMEINRRMGDPDYAATPIVDAWLAEVLR